MITIAPQRRQMHGRMRTYFDLYAIFSQKNNGASARLPPLCERVNNAC
jgi:hypothetical protein